ncbi:carboxylesterase 5A-like isoform X1 [Alosa alosa]|uniref:carboxylesterase 5A-like isoform X1 n=1 Tax=Alosa alosa TaxID=278164 RepID=UPI0020155089|nr:carboxylesterase 5A-like isoform X1 [Alosa alosa]
MTGKLMSLCLLQTLFQLSLSLTDPSPVVSVRNGTLRGASMTVKGSNKQVQQYLGIPFARPPLGPLRLSAPQPAESWEGERDATQQPPMCPQPIAFVTHIAKVMANKFALPGLSEDCLYLNVYTPPTNPCTGKKLPVMVWIHGGALYLGGAAQFDGSVLAAYQDVVVVIIQYRLGILGYFSTGDTNAQGNWGFLDQIAALQWVQENIESFGGDPNSVTIAGQSAGGISASILLLSPLAKGLFHRAIFQSGASTLETYSTKTPMVFAEMVATATGCTSNSTELLVQCIRDKSVEELINATLTTRIFRGATVDGEFLTALPEDILKEKDFHKVPVIVGVTNHEFGWLLPFGVVAYGWEKGMDRATVMKELAIHLPPTMPVETKELVVDEYFKDAHTPQEMRDQFTEIVGDYWMVVPAIKEARYYLDVGASVYMYEFQHRPEAYEYTRPSFVRADHSDELMFIFGACFWDGHIKVTGKITEEENRLCKTMMAYWANFMRTGSPNGPGLVHWPIYDACNKYLNLDLQQSEGRDLKKDRVQFFQKLAAKKTQLQEQDQ